ncbi:class I SAM-dependent methyltransferase [Actinokineospora inagensis]|uniref:class I SAM-dependent methyltransferase n=1 Tax=Actinokineospora inagensis TaxID=103730 RepID=UPI0004244DEA|nr:class I SAM-dependent methyltransferase [Actinokineospora inagensis]
MAETNTFSARTNDPAWMAELERMYDRGTFACLDSLGLHPGLRCLEAGAGGGSVARWLAERVGEVVATDLDVSLVAAGPRLHPRQHDLEHDDLPEGGFDVVHARLLLEHLKDPAAALAKLYAAVRPGGWIVVEDMNWAATHPLPGPGEEIFLAVTSAMRRWLQGTGSHPTLGARLPRLLRGLGATDVGCEGRAHLIEGGTPTAATMVQSLLRRFGPLYVHFGLLTERQVTDGIAWGADPECAGFSALLMATWGRRPPAGTGEGVSDHSGQPEHR